MEGKSVATNDIQIGRRLAIVIGAAVTLLAAVLVLPTAAEAVDNGDAGRFERCRLYDYDYKSALQRLRDATTEAEREQAELDLAEAIDNYEREGCTDLLGGPIGIRPVNTTRSIPTNGVHGTVLSAFQAVTPGSSLQFSRQ